MQTLLRLQCRNLRLWFHCRPLLWLRFGHLVFAGEKTFEVFDQSELYRARTGQYQRAAR